MRSELAVRPFVTDIYTNNFEVRGRGSRCFARQRPDGIRRAFVILPTGFLRSQWAHEDILEVMLAFGSERLDLATFNNKAAIQSATKAMGRSLLIFGTSVPRPGCLGIRKL